MSGSAVQPGAPTHETIQRLFAPLQNASKILLAVSGGPDSTALLLMATRWRQAPGRPAIVAATVDHGMREGSCAEAQGVAALCARLDVEHRLLVWDEPKPTSRIQERARAARYGLLADCAKAVGAEVLVTAHHADDQAETIMFRLLRGSGIGGLSGMAPLSGRDGVQLCRPLLDLEKAELVAYCLEREETYALDPSNTNPRFARTRLRALAAILQREGFGAAEWARLGRRAAAMEDVVQRATAEARDRIDWRSEGNCDARILFALPAEIARRLLAERIAQTSGRAAPALEKMERLAAALQLHLIDAAPFRVNLGGASVALTVKGVLTVRKEAPRRSDGAVES